MTRYIKQWKNGKIIGAKDTKYHVQLNVKTMIRELNTQDEKIKELYDLLTPKCSTCNYFFNFPEYKLKDYEDYPAYCTFRKIYLSDKNPETDCPYWWLNKDRIKKVDGI